MIVTTMASSTRLKPLSNFRRRDFITKFNSVDHLVTRFV
jgi:hypothetical protein